ncbi:MAG: S-methyl-5'-thioadenosine phosphorylase [Rickettsiales bacterium]|nr:S-methyl-5'-thioadenosine phosphorylase [Pseudomonadota bacterium]MDA0966771.1 S-methyl-5'-thioadenosine phosphorylase [Pseudomonadota bacterium]MDG4543443.1 S-methyl-5'-thioadenosine phosphorylase [Rickettsiales bacterium]MDG4546163.1 S-methyl-5'-thioadenosine phosphorylase [Rickettsiales bacterium]MDG4547636.1 S-methyl-5'-thioadenosine phosphorylase [Rickettsiales bacterium]
MLAIIGGTGLYSIDGVEIVGEKTVETPFGSASDVITHAKYGDRDIFFLPRHGKSHSILPHEVNYRANIWALKKLGATKILSVSAIGSLQKELAPGDIVISNQYFDHIKGNRIKTFFGDGLVAHISSAEPVCKELTSVVKKASECVDVKLHEEKTYACVDGPRLGTRAESFFLKNAVKADVVGMTNVPEVFLAREAQMCYCTIGIVTDYDCWQDEPEAHVSLSQVMKRYGKSVGKVKEILNNILSGEVADNNCGCRISLQDAVVTPYDTLSDDKKELLNLLRV